MSIAVFWTIIAGIITATAMLDRVLNLRGRIAFLSSMRRVASSSHELWVERKFDDLLGKKLLSWRSFWLTSFAVVAMWCVGAIWPFITTNQDFVDSIRVNFEHGWPTASAFIAACVIMLITSYYSLCQTRMFLRMLRDRRNLFTVTTVLLADFFANLAIFMIGFSVARLLCNLVVLAFFVHDPLVQQTRYSPLALVAFSDASGISTNTLDNIRDARRDQARAYSTLLTASRHFSASTTNAQLSQIAAAMRRIELGPESSRYSGIVSHTVVRQCETTLINVGGGGYKYLETSTNSLGLVNTLALRFPEASAHPEALSQMLRTNYARIVESGDPACPIPLIVMQRHISLRNLVGSFSIGSLYLATFINTAAETFQEVAYKFSPYIATNTSNDLDYWLPHAVAIESSSTFGPGNDFLAALSMVAEGPGEELSYRGPIISLPLSLFMGGAIFTSGLLWIYLLVWLLRGSVVVACGVISRSLWAINVRKNPATVFALVGFALLAIGWAVAMLVKLAILSLF